jgi:chemotaxis response regulator CheB
MVGIGCSAGGLEALQSFLAQGPPRAGLAFAVVQHLDPDHVSALPGLLQRATQMPVVQAAQGMPVESGLVYVIPPGKDLALVHGALQLPNSRSRPCTATT